MSTDVLGAVLASLPLLLVAVAVVAASRWTPLERPMIALAFLLLCLVVGALLAVLLGRGR